MRTGLEVAIEVDTVAMSGGILGVGAAVLPPEAVRVSAELITIRIEHRHDLKTEPVYEREIY